MPNRRVRSRGGRGSSTRSETGSVRATRVAWTLHGRTSGQGPSRVSAGGSGKCAAHGTKGVRDICSGPAAGQGDARPLTDRCAAPPGPGSDAIQAPSAAAGARASCRPARPTALRRSAPAKPRRQRRRQAVRLQLRGGAPHRRRLAGDDKVSGTIRLASGRRRGRPPADSPSAAPPVLKAIPAQRRVMLQVGADLGNLLVRQPFGDQRPPSLGANGADIAFVFKSPCRAAAATTGRRSRPNRSGGGGWIRRRLTCNDTDRSISSVATSPPEWP